MEIENSLHLFSLCVTPVHQCLSVDSGSAPFWFGRLEGASGSHFFRAALLHMLEIVLGPHTSCAQKFFMLSTKQDTRRNALNKRWHRLPTEAVASMPWRSSKATWAWSWATCYRWLCWGRDVTSNLNMLSFSGSILCMVTKGIQMMQRGSKCCTAVDYPLSLIHKSVF